MKKTWVNAEISELNIVATANIPTTEMAVDEIQNGYGRQGIRTSGPVEKVPYYPQEN